MIDDTLATEVILEAEAILEASEPPVAERLQRLMQHLHDRLPHSARQEADDANLA